MKRGRKESRREHNAVIAANQEAAKLAARLAPLEERMSRRSGLGQNNGGAIVVDTDDLKLPSDFTEREEGRPRLFRLDPIGLIILIFALAFIGFIAYQISIEPPKAQDEQKPAVVTQP